MESRKMTFSTLYPRSIQLLAIILFLGAMPLGTSHAGEDELKRSRRPALVLYASAEQQTELDHAAAEYGFLTFQVNDFSDIATDLHSLGGQQSFDSRRVYKLPVQLAASGINWKKMLNRRLISAEARALRHAIAENGDVSNLLIDAVAFQEIQCMTAEPCGNEQLLAVSSVITRR
jgi:hypothetical protein